MSRWMRLAAVAGVVYALVYRQDEVLSLLGWLVGGVRANMLPRDACDASYPTVCIPSPPPYLSCDEIGERGFKIDGNDPHFLDPDRNGRGCDG